MEYFNPVKIYFSKGIRADLVAKCEGKEVLIICTNSAFNRFKQDIKLSNFFLLENCKFEHGFSSNPGLLEIINITEKYNDINFDLIIGLGGGSAMDVAKIISVSIPAYKNGISINRLLEDNSLFKLFDEIDCIQVPTTAGTGSEVTPFATVWDYEESQKKSLSNPKMYAKETLIDPDFLIDIPFEIALSTGLDALNQSLESLWNKNATKTSLIFASRSADISLKSLTRLRLLYKDYSLRSDLMESSIFAGIAISQTRTAICHSISYPLTLNFNLAHGFACAFSMIEVLKFNSNLISERVNCLNSYNSVEKIRRSIEGILEMHNFNDYLIKSIPQESYILKIIDEMYTSGRFENNIRDCSKSDLESIITKSCKRIFK